MVSAFQSLVPKWEAEKGLVLMQIQDVAENMSLEEGKAFYYRLINLAKGKALPNREDPYEWITYDTFAAMRAVDEHLTKDVLQDAILCVEAQVDEARNQCVSMGTLLKQRYKEGGVR
jgi:quinol monooxygenase YgiN